MWAKRAARDIMQLKEAGYKVRNAEGGEDLGNMSSFLVNMRAPKDSAYEGFEYDILFTITEKFPFSSPSIGFKQRIYHPNVDEMSGSICLDSLNKTWSPAFTLVNIVEAQLPYLLQYPNPADPFNREAAARLARSKDEFKTFVQDHCSRYARKA